MFRPFPATIRYSSESMVVVLYRIDMVFEKGQTTAADTHTGQQRVNTYSSFAPQARAHHGNPPPASLNNNHINHMRSHHRDITTTIL